MRSFSFLSIFKVKAYFCLIVIRLFHDTVDRSMCCCKNRNVGGYVCRRGSRNKTIRRLWNRNHVNQQESNKCRKDVRQQHRQRLHPGEHRRKRQAPHHRVRPHGNDANLRLHLCWHGPLLTRVGVPDRRHRLLWQRASKIATNVQHVSRP